MNGLILLCSECLKTNIAQVLV